MTGRTAFGIDTFGDVTVDDEGRRLTHAEVIRNVVDEAVLADRVGVDAIGLGEHHRDDFAIPAPDMVLATIAGRTTRIHLGSAVTVLSSDDPVRVFERFSTLQALSDGRAEITVGRGSFTESFPLFGLDLADYERLFDEKLDLFATLLRANPVTWSGTVRAPLADQHLFPPLDVPLPAWVAVGGSPESVVRAASHGLPLMLAIIGGAAERFAPFVELYHRALEKFELPTLPVGVHSPGHIAATDEQALDQLWPHHRVMHDRIAAERGWGPMSREAFEHAAGPHGAMYVGSPETVARKIADTVQLLGLDRFDLKYASGPMPHSQLMASIEAYGAEVIPRVRELLATDAA